LKDRLVKHNYPDNFCNVFEDNRFYQNNRMFYRLLESLAKNGVAIPRNDNIYTRLRSVIRALLDCPIFLERHIGLWSRFKNVSNVP
jgi:hypothetical protein